MRREYSEAPIVGVGAIIFNDENQILLIQRGQEPLKGEWSLPGGALELGETLEQGIRREVLEETGLEVEPVQIAEVFDRIVHDEAGLVRFHYVLVDYLCRVTGGTLCCASDAAAGRWASREELNAHSIYRVAPFTVAVIEKAFSLRIR
ncbi:NUDIX hydrolase [Acidobacterium sp. S8]|uniref:NUDIX hydrolase n=1 Tax=Acidobacterium sp. S8 TaxID=1641854 RepID=UPI00131A908A|nr:NUDIX hydrolase [Acidobacterium sp. S8]